MPPAPSAGTRSRSAPSASSLAIAGTFGAWLGGKLDDWLGPKRVIAGSMLILLLAIVAILLVDKDSILFVKVAPPRARRSACSPAPPSAPISCSAA